ncbi:hypothetical protein LEP1GSC005_4099 [Leptospira santarosai str. ST188]|nr:hypothetical protein LEP1GSC005_4099 [Leptospira santarosai str. ST188]
MILPYDLRPLNVQSSETELSEKSKVGIKSRIKNHPFMFASLQSPEPLPRF